MKKITILMVLWVFIGVTKTISPIPAHAGQSIKTQLEPSVEAGVDRRLTSAQTAMRSMNRFWTQSPSDERIPTSHPKCARKSVKINTGSTSGAVA